MRTVRKLECGEFREVYQKNVKTDFPANERRPWFAIQKVWQNGKYTAYGYEEDGNLIAYAALYSGGEVPYVLLDYYAVIRELRGRGIGSAFLGDLRSAIPGTGGVFIESENPASAKNGEERETREKRLSFYEKNGAAMTGVNCRLFGMDYSLLYLSVDTELHSVDEFMEAVSSLYRVVYRPFRGSLCHVYKAEDV